MIICKIMGGLGNQMFQYAYGYTLAQKYGQEMVLDISWFSDKTKNPLNRQYELNKFNLSYSRCIEKKNIPFFIRILENKYINKLIRIINLKKIKLFSYEFLLNGKGNYERNDEPHPNIYLDGYWQNCHLFEGYEEKIRKEFQPKIVMSEEYFDLERQISNGNNLAMHFRRTDKIKTKYDLDNDYYMKAFQYCNSKNSLDKIFIFSDDIDWCKKNLKFDLKTVYVHFSNCNSAIEEMIAMSKSKNVIIAKSTYSWWSGWLSNTKAQIIAPDFGWLPNLIPNNWLKL